MTFPKQLIIGGIPWKIVFDKKQSGGEFKWKDHTIRIEADYSDDRKWSVLVHEVAEVIMVNNSMRYQEGYSTVGNADYLFSFNHKEFEIFTDELAGVLKEILKRR